MSFLIYGNEKKTTSQTPEPAILSEKYSGKKNQFSIPLNFLEIKIIDHQNIKTHNDPINTRESEIFTSFDNKMKLSIYGEKSFFYLEELIESKLSFQRLYTANTYWQEFMKSNNLNLQFTNIHLIKEDFSNIYSMNLLFNFSDQIIFGLDSFFYEKFIYTAHIPISKTNNNWKKSEKTFFNSPYVRFIWTPKQSIALHAFFEKCVHALNKAKTKQNYNLPLDKENLSWGLFYNNNRPKIGFFSLIAIEHHKYFYNDPLNDKNIFSSSLEVKKKIYTKVNVSLFIQRNITTYLSTSPLQKEFGSNVQVEQKKRTTYEHIYKLEANWTFLSQFSLGLSVEKTTNRSKFFNDRDYELTKLIFTLNTWFLGEKKETNMTRQDQFLRQKVRKT